MKVWVVLSVWLSRIKLRIYMYRFWSGDMCSFFSGHYLGVESLGIMVNECKFNLIRNDLISFF